MHNISRVAKCPRISRWEPYDAPPYSKKGKYNSKNLTAPGDVNKVKVHVFSRSRKTSLRKTMKVRALKLRRIGGKFTRRVFFIGIETIEKRIVEKLYPLGFIFALVKTISIFSW